MLMRDMFLENIGKFVVIRMVDGYLSMFTVGKLVEVVGDGDIAIAIIEENGRIYKYPLKIEYLGEKPVVGFFNTRKEAMEVANELARNPR